MQVKDLQNKLKIQKEDFVRTVNSLETLKEFSEKSYSFPPETSYKDIAKYRKILEDNLISLAKASKEDENANKAFKNLSQIVFQLKEAESGLMISEFLKGEKANQVFLPHFGSGLAVNPALESVRMILKMRNPKEKSGMSK